MAARKKKIPVPACEEAIKVDGKWYDRTDGTRLTDCHGTYSTYHDTTLCCKACWGEVDFGQGDGSEIRKDVIGKVA